MKTFLFFLLSLLYFTHTTQAQYTRQDSLLGFLNPFRAAYNVHDYHLNLTFDLDNQSISGSNTIFFKTLTSTTRIQVDLNDTLEIDSITWRHRKLDFSREFSAVFIDFEENLLEGALDSITIYYHGHPIKAVNPPWEGGFIYAKTPSDEPFISVACQGLGASTWWPCKDHLSDEPDSMRMTFTVPAGLDCISNGQFKGVDTTAGFTTFNWKVTYPINTYNVTFYIARYQHLRDIYISPEGDTLELDYYVLPGNQKKAGKHFEQVKPMLNIFGNYYGRYPFWKDGYKLVEAPYWGMEHQSAIAYGNNYKNLEYGFDFIIIHESAHEWWGNSVSSGDLADMWINEAFTTYSEALYLEAQQGEDKARQYLAGQKAHINDLAPLIGDYDVYSRDWRDTDIYYKGAWMLHSIRNTIADDSLWFAILKGLYQEYEYQVISSQAVIEYIDHHTEFNLNPIFEQFLTVSYAPRLQYSLEKTDQGVKMIYHWLTSVKDFNMPVLIEVNKKMQRIFPDTGYQQIMLEGVPEFLTSYFYYELEELP